MTDPAPSRIRRQLAAELVRLRQPSGITGRRMAELLGVSQATISRIDNGRGPVPRPEQITTWLDATGATEGDRERILALVSAAHNEATPWPELLAEHHGNLQADVAERESAAVAVRNFQPTVIAGLLQTAAYTRALLPVTDLTGQLDYPVTMAGRIDRQQILYQDGRQFRFLIAEHVLHWSPGSDVMPAQLDRLVQLADLPNVDIAVLPTSVAVATPWHGFNFYESADGTGHVFLELIHRVERVTEEWAVELYRKLWNRLWSAAAVGDEAVEVIRGLRT